LVAFYNRYLTSCDSAVFVKRTAGRYTCGTLERLARDAEGVVRYAADRILEADRQRAG